MRILFEYRAAFKKETKQNAACVDGNLRSKEFHPILLLLLLLLICFVSRISSIFSSFTDRIINGCFKFSVHCFLSLPLPHSPFVCALCLVESRLKWCKSRTHTHRERGRAGAHTHIPLPLMLKMEKKARARVVNLSKIDTGERAVQRNCINCAFSSVFMCVCVFVLVRDSMETK